MDRFKANPGLRPDSLRSARSKIQPRVRATLAYTVPCGGRSSRNTERHPLCHRLGAIVSPKLAQDLLHVVLHRELADAQNLADVGVALALLHPAQNFHFTRREGWSATKLLHIAAAVAVRPQPAGVQVRQQKRDQACL